MFSGNLPFRATTALARLDMIREEAIRAMELLRAEEQHECHGKLRKRYQYVALTPD
jgi:hypothetical protein